MRLASKLAAALAVFFCCLSGFGQAAPISGQAVDQNGVPIPFAQVRVCSVTSSGTPCTPTTFIYYDYNLQNVAPNPYTTDQYGNYTVYAPALAAPNLYVVQLSPASGVTWTYVQNGPYCSLSGCTFTGPVTAPYFNATQSPYYEVNGVQLASTNLLDTTNIAYINKANTFTGSPQTAPVINATTGFQNAGAAALNHVLLGNGTEYVDSATIPWSVISGGSGAGPFSNTGVPCPTNNFSSINCTSTQMVTALAGAAVLTAPSAAQAITYNVNGVNSLTISNPNAGASAATGLIFSNGTDEAAFSLAGTGTGSPGTFAFQTSRAGAGIIFNANNGLIEFGSENGHVALELDASDNATFEGNVFTGGDITDGGLSAGAGNCVQAGTAGILTTAGAPCATAPAFTGTSGYQIQSSGLIEQWAAGPSESANFSGPVTVTLPFTFPTGCFLNSVQITTQVASSPTGNGSAYSNYAQSCTATTVTVWMDVGPDSVGSVNHNVLVRILGY